MMRVATVGAELELSDLPHAEAAALWPLDLRDVTMVNSSGIAVDPRGEVHDRGAEIQTRPTDGPQGQAGQLADIVNRWPQTTVNFRSNLHVHVRVPGLAEDLAALKRVQAHIHRWMPQLFALGLETIPEPAPEDYPVAAELRGARMRRNRRRVSHQRLLKPDRLVFQLEAHSPRDFFNREVMGQAGQLHWAINPRLCVNLRQLLETDTVEFRHFPGTTKPRELQAAVAWCIRYMELALQDEDPRFESAGTMAAFMSKLPLFEPYVHWMEVGYHFTCRKYHDAETCRANIARWLADREGVLAP